MKYMISSMTLEICGLLMRLDELFIGTLAGWLPIAQAELEYIRPKRIHGNTKEATLKIRPEHWPVESEIFCKLIKTGNIWNICEITIKAPHIHHTEIGGIDIVLPVIGGQILMPQEIGSPSSEIISSIILAKKSKMRLRC